MRGEDPLRPARHHAGHSGSTHHPHGVRLPYIQMASNGNTRVILSSGLGVRRDPKPTPALDAPLRLIIELTTNPGQMIITWDAVEDSRSFILQQSLADTAERDWITIRTGTERNITLNNLTIGQPYAFRVATIGGATGQSPWSLEVIRSAA